MPSDLDHLQGKWYVWALEVDGAEVPAEALVGAAVRVSGNLFESFGMGAPYSGRLVAADGRLGLHFEDGPEEGNVHHGIYKLGRDEWTLCLSTTGGPAPTDSPKGLRGVALESLKRQRPLHVPSAPVREAAPGARFAELQGDWAMVSCVRNGEPLPPSLVRSGRRTVSGTQSVIRFGSQVFQSGTLERVADEPGAVDMVTEDGVYRGIYSVDGDRLKVCFGRVNGPRPTEYVSRSGDGRTFAEWQRVIG